MKISSYSICILFLCFSVSAAGSSETTSVISGYSTNNCVSTPPLQFDTPYENTVPVPPINESAYRGSLTPPRLKKGPKKAKPTYEDDLTIMFPAMYFFETLLFIYYGMKDATEPAIMDWIHLSVFGIGCMGVHLNVHFTPLRCLMASFMWAYSLVYIYGAHSGLLIYTIALMLKQSRTGVFLFMFYEVDDELNELCKPRVPKVEEIMTKLGVSRDMAQAMVNGVATGTDIKQQLRQIFEHLKTIGWVFTPGEPSGANMDLPALRKVCLITDKLYSATFPEGHETAFGFIYEGVIPDFSGYIKKLKSPFADMGRFLKTIAENNDEGFYHTEYGLSTTLFLIIIDILCPEDVEWNTYAGFVNSFLKQRFDWLKRRIMAKPLRDQMQIFEAYSNMHDSEDLIPFNWEPVTETNQRIPSPSPPPRSPSPGRRSPNPRFRIPETTPPALLNGSDEPADVPTPDNAQYELSPEPMELPVDDGQATPTRPTQPSSPPNIKKQYASAAKKRRREPEENDSDDEPIELPPLKKNNPAQNMAEPTQVGDEPSEDESSEDESSEDKNNSAQNKAESIQVGDESSEDESSEDESSEDEEDIPTFKDAFKRFNTNKIFNRFRRELDEVLQQKGERCTVLNLRPEPNDKRFYTLKSGRMAETTGKAVWDKTIEDNFAGLKDKIVTVSFLQNEVLNMHQWLTVIGPPPVVTRIIQSDLFGFSEILKILDDEKHPIHDPRATPLKDLFENIDDAKANGVYEDSEEGKNKRSEIQRAAIYVYGKLIDDDKKKKGSAPRSLKKFRPEVRNPVTASSSGQVTTDITGIGLLAALAKSNTE